jgi:hypothetical protein
MGREFLMPERISIALWQYSAKRAPSRALPWFIFLFHCRQNGQEAVAGRWQGPADVADENIERQKFFPHAQKAGFLMNASAQGGTHAF